MPPSFPTPSARRQVIHRLKGHPVQSSRTPYAFPGWLPSFRPPAGYKSRVYKEANAGTQPPKSGILILGAVSSSSPRLIRGWGFILPPRDGSPLLPCKISVPRRRKKSKSFLLPAASPRLTGNGKHDTLNPWNRNFPDGVFRHRVSIHDGGAAG